MEEVDISAAAVVVHLLISWIPWLIGIAVGGGLGVLCALVIRTSVSIRPALRYPLAMVPWRTLLMGLLMAAWSPFIVTLLWIGPITGGVMVGASLSVLTMAFTVTTLVENWHPSPLAARLIAGARTLAVASCLIAAGVGLLGGGGLGYIILEAARHSRYGSMWTGLLVILALALALDLALGLAQKIALQRAGDSSEAAIAGRIAA